MWLYGGTFTSRQHGARWHWCLGMAAAAAIKPNVRTVLHGASPPISSYAAAPLPVPQHVLLTSNSTSAGMLNSVLMRAWNSRMPSGPGRTAIRCTRSPRATTMTGCTGALGCCAEGVSVRFQSGSSCEQKRHQRSSLQQHAWWRSMRFLPLGNRLHGACSPPLMSYGSHRRSVSPSACLLQLPSRQAMAVHQPGTCAGRHQAAAAVQADEACVAVDVSALALVGACGASAAAAAVAAAVH